MTLYFGELDKLSLGQVIQSSGGRDDYMGGLFGIFQLILIFLERYTAKVASIAQVFEIST